MPARVSRVHRSPLRATTLRHTGWALFGVGAAGDLGHHTLPHHLSMALTPFVGPNAYYAHVLTLVGMLTLVASVLWQAARHAH
jgi:hypothetical protein